ncbi:MAG: hypothetical protein ACRDGA_09855 [Bacteroidota bacterium]
MIPLLHSQDTVKVEHRPFVTGGIYDKPFMTRLGGKTTIGGYMDVLGSFHREAGVNEGWSFEARRFNLFTYSVLTDGLVVASEIEMEHGGEEFKLEYAILDLTFHEALNLRGGIILSPLGKTNLVHDSPKLELAERPLVSSEIIPSTLSEVGIGFFGAFYPTDLSRVTYEVYAVNGFNQDVIEEAPGTRINVGKGRLFGEDNNGEPAFVGRVAFSPTYSTDFGLSFHAGAYNIFQSEGLNIDDRRTLSIFALDAEHNEGWIHLQGEAAYASIELPQSLKGLFAEKQFGYFLQANVPFGEDLFPLWPRSKFIASARFEMVDFDRDIRGDDHARFTVGLNFRPVQDVALKFNYEQDWVRDREKNLTRSVGFIIALASYF